MIVATKSGDVYLKGVVKPDKLLISRPESIGTSIRVDPAVEQPSKEAYVLTSDDLRNPKVRKEFLSNLAQKHPDSRVVFISRTNKTTPDIDPNAFDAFLSKPTTDAVREVLKQFAEDASSKAKFSARDMNAPIPEYKPAEPQEETTQEEEPVEEPVEEVDVPVPVPVVEEPKSTAEDDNYLLQRIRNAEHWAALNTVVSEVSAARIVQEVAAANAAFRQSEAYVTALSENITAIMANPSYSTQEKLTKVHSVLCDRAYVRSKTNSITEQAVENIIRAITEKATEFVSSYTDSIDESVIKAMACYEAREAPNSRLATIVENRAKVLLELNTMDLEIRGLYNICQKTLNDTVDNITSDSSPTTGSPILDSQVQNRAGVIVPEGLLDCLDLLFKGGSEMSEDFNKMSELVQSTIRKLYALLTKYQEENEVLSETIRYMQANNVEDTVVANTILKKTQRLFVYNDDYDSAAIAYMVARDESRKNDNVLLLDVSGTDFFHSSGISAVSYSKFMDNEYLNNKFMVVSTFGDDSVPTFTGDYILRMSSRLLTYSKHYSRVYIMASADQMELINAIKSEVLSISYFVDCLPKNIKKMAGVIAASSVPNTAERVVLVNYVGDSVRICTDLGIIDRYDVQMFNYPPIKELRVCLLNNTDPYDVDSIYKTVSGVM